jgi:hypothetical protein
MFRIVLIYGIAKVIVSGVSWLGLSSTRRNIAMRLEELKRKPTTRKRPRTMELSARGKFIKIIPPLMLLPGLGEALLIAITLGRFSNKVKIEEVYQRALRKTDDDNINDALDMMGDANRVVYRDLRKNASFLSVMGHSEIANQSIIALNNLVVDANIAGMNLKEEPSIKDALRNTSELISELLREEQLGVQSNIDTYLNVIGSIKEDLAGKKSVFMDPTPSGK